MWEPYVGGGRGALRQLMSGGAVNSIRHSYFFFNSSSVHENIEELIEMNFT